MATLASNTIFTNVALTPEGGVWWEGMTDTPPGRNASTGAATSGRPRLARKPASPRRTPTDAFTAPASQCPSIDLAAWESPDGVPISAFLFGGRQADDDASRLPGIQLV